MLHKSSLHKLQMAGLAQALNVGDLVSGAHDGERQAGVNTEAVHIYGASAAQAAVTFLFGSGKIEILAQAIQQSGSRIELDLVRFAVHTKCERDHVAGPKVLRSSDLV
jgi:hypothetical protein